MTRKKLMIVRVGGALLAMFFLSLFLNIQDVLSPNILSRGSIYNEYLDISYYLFDFLWALLVVYFIIYNKYYKMSSIGYRLFHVEQSQRVFIIAPLVFMALIIFSNIFSHSISLSLRQTLIFIEAVAAYYLIIISLLFHVEHNQAKITTVPRETVDIVIKMVLIFALFNCFLVFIQFFTEESVGVSLLGESHLSIGESNTATVNIFGQKFLRGYGLFLHPNILGAFLAIFIYLYLTFSYYFVPRETQNSEQSMFHVKRIVIAVLSMALILTFSKIAIVGLLCIMYKHFYIDQKNVPRETQNSEQSMFHVKHLLVLAIVLLIAILMMSQKSFSEREMSLLTYSQSINPSLFGSGVGTYFYEMESHYRSYDNTWILQPVHNFFLIILNEVGILALFVIIIFIVSFFQRSIFSQMFHVEQKRVFLIGEDLALLIVLLSISDHYFFTIPQGIFLFWVTLAVASSLQIQSIDKNVK